MPKYRCIVATPTAQLFSGDIDYANIPGIEGDFGVLSNHEQFVGLNRAGLVTLTVDEGSGDKKRFAIYNGISQMFNNHLTILAQMGRPIEGIDVADAREKLEATKRELEQIQAESAKTDDAQTETREDYIAWCELQIKLAQGEVV